MKKVIARAPVRADLAGGTLDLWPLYLFHPGARTVNVAISYYAESEVAETGDSGIEIHLTDQQYEQRYESLHEIAANPIDGEDLIALVRDLETRLIGVPAGIQDYYPAVYGALAAIHLNPGA